MARFHQGTKKRLAPVALLAFVALALTGCMRVHMDLDISADDTVSGTVVMAVSDSLIDLMGPEAEGLFDDAGFEDHEGVTVEEYAQDDYTGKQYHFAGTPLDEFSDGEMSITREGDEFVLEGTLDMSEGVEDVPAELADSFDVRVSFTFPGEVIETNGEVSGTTVTWVPEIGNVNEMTARASATGDGALGSLSGVAILAIVLGAVVVVAAVVIVVVVVTRKKHAAVAAPGAATFAAAHPPASAPTPPPAQSDPNPDVPPTAPPA